MNVVCATCRGSYERTVKQVNQAIKRRGEWRCVKCAAGHNALSLEGKTFGRLRVMSRADTVLEKSMWNCICECGKTTVTTGSLLNCGHTKSCGCGIGIATRKRCTTHAKTVSREYRAWQAMRARCNNPAVVNYPSYGGRGIKICVAWDSFQQFFADMGECPQGYSIERVDVNGMYEPSNCKWASRIEQARNTRRNRFLTLNGVTKCLKAWADDLGIDQASLRERLEKWPLERALTTPKRSTK